MAYVELAAWGLGHILVMLLQNFVEPHVIEIDILFQLKEFVANGLSFLQT